MPGHGGLSVQRRGVGPAIVPELRADAGERVLVASPHPDRVRQALRALLASGDFAPDDARQPLVLVDGVDYSDAPGRERRRLVGFASGRLPLERGSVGRLAGYRCPDADDAEVEAVLRWTGLGERLDAAPDGLATKLQNDGSPWPGAAIAQLKLARALLGTPPVLVLEDLDAQLDADGLARLRQVLAEYPGVVLFSSSQPDALVDRYRVWHVGDAPLLADDDAPDDDEGE